MERTPAGRMHPIEDLSLLSKLIFVFLSLGDIGYNRADLSHFAFGVLRRYAFKLRLEFIPVFSDKCDFTGLF